MYQFILKAPNAISRASSKQSAVGSRLPDQFEHRAEIGRSGRQQLPLLEFCVSPLTEISVPAQEGRRQHADPKP